MLAMGLAAWFTARMRGARAARLLVPFLATPHAAMAIGLAFLIAPSGWIARALSPWATGWTLPPDVATVHDPAGIALILGLYSRWVSLPLVPILLGSIYVPHGAAGFFFSNEGGGWEFPAFWAVTLVVQALLGDGAFALKRSRA